MNKVISLHPIQLRPSATHYCKYCYTWGTLQTDIDNLYGKMCPNCNNVGYLILNPFPDNLVPYHVMEVSNPANQLAPSKPSRDKGIDLYDKYLEKEHEKIWEEDTQDGQER